ncbi:MlaC/ttg2D family ABC transporter substrate-binding protein [Candidatus Thiodiazotropha sp. CDECU1]|uniref:MlaC/ttg2D family ABC transporter substrate-binding protein n=1 Tax=Candidatus Thiodiazotropha sp. CDECU1 TaxID=3065865 RepID=UPI0029306D5E|nr:ABC transporter substrate-binding protein [Candidatus Thiodiazotropha sp. CDECU1]
MKRVLIAIASMSLFATSVLAAPGYNYPASRMQAPAYQEVGPDTLLREGMTKLLRYLRTADNPQPRQISGFLEREVAPYFDFAYMATWAAGPMNRSMNDQQRMELAQQIKTLLLGTLAKRLISYDNQDVRFYRPRRVGDNEVKVRVGILRAGGYPANLDFRFYRSESGWKVFDVSANGNSALAYYRRHFANQSRTQTGSRNYRR